MSLIIVTTTQHDFVMDVNVIMIEVTRNDLRLNIHLNPFLLSFSKHNNKLDQQDIGTPKASLVVEDQ
jgi:hypothetical protein